MDPSHLEVGVYTREDRPIGPRIGEGYGRFLLEVQALEVVAVTGSGRSRSVCSNMGTHVGI